jgi:hypothetical protein
MGPRYCLGKPVIEPGVRIKAAANFVPFHFQGGNDCPVDNFRLSPVSDNRQPQKALALRRSSTEP